MAEKKHGPITQQRKIAGRIKERMYLEKMEEDELAAILDCSPRTISNRFKYPGTFTIDELGICAKALGCTIADFVIDIPINRGRTA